MVTLMKQQSWNWGSDNDSALKLIMSGERHPDRIKEVFENVSDLNAWHVHRNAEYNLLFHSIVECHQTAFITLLELGADPSARNSSGNNALSPILKRGLLQWADACLQVVQDQNKDDKAAIKFMEECVSTSGWTLLMAAAENDRLQVTEWLLARGLSPNTRMPMTGWTAMHAAAKMGHKEVLKLLLERGGDKNIRARHRNFGGNLKVEDVTTDKDILQILSEF